MDSREKRLPFTKIYRKAASFNATSDFLKIAVLFPDDWISRSDNKDLICSSFAISELFNLSTLGERSITAFALVKRERQRERERARR